MCEINWSNCTPQKSQGPRSKLTISKYDYNEASNSNKSDSEGGVKKYN